jgi:hypothetical protein
MHDSQPKIIKHRSCWQGERHAQTKPCHKPHLLLNLKMWYVRAQSYYKKRAMTFTKCSIFNGTFVLDILQNFLKGQIRLITSTLVYPVVQKNLDSSNVCSDALGNRMTFIIWIVFEYSNWNTRIKFLLLLKVFQASRRPHQSQGQASLGQFHVCPVCKCCEIEMKADWTAHATIVYVWWECS